MLLIYLVKVKVTKNICNYVDVRGCTKFQTIVSILARKKLNIMLKLVSSTLGKLKNVKRKSFQQ